MNTNNTADISPVFITGAWRSGTTLVSRILNNHQELDITYDTVHFMRFSYGKYDPVGIKKNAERLITDTNKRLKYRYNLEFSVKDVINDLNEVYTYSSIYDAIMMNLLLKKSHKKVWGEKTNLAWTKIPAFFEMFPNGRVIHIIRDPRAVLSSWKKFTHAPGNDYLDSVLNCYDSMQLALKYKTQYANNRYIYLTYEELVTRPHETVERLCQNISVDYVDSMLDVNNFIDRSGKQWMANTVYKDKINGISMATIDKWKSELKDWEIALTDKIMGNMIDKFHYLPANLENNQALIENALKEVLVSNLASDGFIRYLLTGNGFERYPSDPLDDKNWATISNKKIK